MPKQVRGSPKKKGKLTFEQLHMPSSKKPQAREPVEPQLKWHEGPWSVPPGMALALGSNRPELIRLAIGDVERGATEVNKQLVIELMRLVADCMIEAKNQKAEISNRDATLEYVAKTIKTVRESNHLLGEAYNALLGWWPVDTEP